MKKIIFIIIIILINSKVSADTFEFTSDKQHHMLVGSVIYKSVSTSADRKTAVAVTFAVAAAKELYDMTGRGTPSYHDFLYTVMPAVISQQLGAEWEIKIKKNSVKIFFERKF